MGKRDDEGHCPLYTTISRSKKTHESLKGRLKDTPRFNCTKITDAYWADCPLRSEDDTTLSLPGPGVTLLPPSVDRPYLGTRYTKIWIESVAPRYIRYADGRTFLWEWSFNLAKWGAFVEWLPLDGEFEREMLHHRIRKMGGKDAAEVQQVIKATQSGSWMLEYYIAMYFSREYFMFPYVLNTLVLDKNGKPLLHPEGGWIRMVGVDVTVVEEIGADGEAMMEAAEAFYPPLYHAINRVRLLQSEFS